MYNKKKWFLFAKKTRKTIDMAKHYMETEPHSTLSTRFCKNQTKLKNTCNE